MCCSLQSGSQGFCFTAGNFQVDDETAGMVENIDFFLGVIANLCFPCLAQVAQIILKCSAA